MVIIFLTSCNSGDALSDKTYSDTIKQTIGGNLIRNVHYWNTFHSTNYDITYHYLDKSDKNYIIGKGSYQEQNLPKNEQIIRLGKWTVFKTSKSREADEIFIGNKIDDVWKTYEISPNLIEQTEMYKKLKLNSDTIVYDTKSKVIRIDPNGNVTALYVFGLKNRIFSFERDKRLVNFKIDLQTGNLIMKSILKQ